MRRRCTCGHPYREHQHHRAGLDCALCTCDGWHWRWVHRAAWRRWRAYRRLVASGERELRRG